MMNNEMDAMMFLTTEESQKALLGWFDILSERNVLQVGSKINGRAWRAELRRAEPPYGAMLCEGYNELCRRLGAKMRLTALDTMALALFASVAPHLKNHNGKGSFAAQLGQTLNGSTPCLSKLRFERLLNARTPDDLCRLLIQAARIRGQEGGNVLSLADSLLIWMREWQAREQQQPEPANPFARHRVRWTHDYLSPPR